MRPFKGFAATLLTVTKVVIAFFCIGAIVLGVAAGFSPALQAGAAELQSLLSQYHMTPEGVFLLAKTSLKVCFGDKYALAVSAIAAFSLFIGLTLLQFVWDIIEGFAFLSLRIAGRGRGTIATMHSFSDIVSVYGALTCAWCVAVAVMTLDRIKKLCDMASLTVNFVFWLCIAFVAGIIVCLIVHAFHRGVRHAMKGDTETHLTGLCVFFGICSTLVTGLCGLLSLSYFGKSLSVMTLLPAVFALRFFAAARCHDNAKEQ